MGKLKHLRIAAEYEVDGIGKGRDLDELSSAAGETWRLLVCPACNEVNVGLMRWYDHIEISDEFKMEIVYPA
jgi:hypothetical protein